MQYKTIQYNTIQNNTAQKIQNNTKHNKLTENTAKHYKTIQ